MRTIASEWIKLRTVLVHWVLAVIAILFPVVITVLAASFGTWTSNEALLSRDIAGLVVGTSIVSAMLLGAMAAISLTSEYAHNTIRPTFAATPSRPLVHASKLVVNSGVVVALAAAATFLSWFAAQAVLGARDRTIGLGEDDVLAPMVSLVVLAVLVASFGFALGLLIRNSAATVTILLLWPLIIESLIGGLLSVVGWDGAVKYLPYSAALAATVADADTGDDILGRPWGLLWFGAVVAVLLAVGVVVDRRRDA